MKNYTKYKFLKHDTGTRVQLLMIYIRKNIWNYALCYNICTQHPDLVSMQFQIVFMQFLNFD